MTVTVRKCLIAEIGAHDDFKALAREYSEECAIAGLPAPAEKIAAYHLIEASGFFQAYGAYVDDRMVGFVAVLTPIIPHYGVAITLTELFFVGKQHRKTGAGLRLLAAAEAHAEAAGSPGMLISAPSGGVLAEVLPRRGYRETNRVFYKDKING